MKKNRTIRTIAVLMAFILILTSSNLDVVRANGMDATQEVSGSIASEESATDKVSYAIDGDTFLKMLSDAQRQAPIQNLFDVFGYESEELNAQLLLENIELYLVGEPMIQDQYRIFTFLQKEKSGALKVVFFTENTTQDMINAELNVEVGCLEEVSSNEVVEYSLVEVTTGEQKIEEPATATEKPATEEPVVEEPTVASESAITVLSVGEPLGMLNEAPQDTDKEVIEDAAEVTKPETSEEAPEVTNLETPEEVPEVTDQETPEVPKSETVEETPEVTKPETIEETPEVPKQETPEDVTEETKQETEQKQESLINTVTRTALLSVFSISNTEIAPTINKAAVLDADSSQSVDYDVTLTVNGASKTSSTTTTQLADVIFVLDISNSMNQYMGDDTRWGKLQTAMDRMVTTLLPASSQNRISIVAYGGSRQTQRSDFSILLSKSSDATVTKNIYNKTLGQMQNSVFGSSVSGGGTNSKDGFVGALKELQALSATSANRNQYVIYMSDGEPTFYKNYYDEYLNGEFLDTCPYTSISSNEGFGNSYIKEGAWQAINVARRINQDFPNAAIYTVGIGATDTFAAYILNTANYANGGFNKTYKSAESASDLEAVFAALTQTVNTSTTLTNLAAQDQLSAYVDINEESPIEVNGTPIEPTINSQNENQIDYIRNSVEVANYNKETKTINWTVAASLGEGQTSTLTYSVHTTEEAIAYEDTYKGKENCYQGTANSGTHASNNGLSEDTQYGYHSNVNAFVTYMDEEESGTVTFNHPVVQSVVRGTLTINKQLDKTYVGLSSDTLYSFNVTLESAKLTEDAMTHITFSADRLHTIPAFVDGKVAFTVQLKATENICIGNLPIDARYTVTENMAGFDNAYYTSNGVTIAANDGSDNLVTGASASGTLTRVGIVGREDYGLICYEKADGSQKWYNASTMDEIINSQLITKLIANKTNVHTSVNEIGKEINGIWTAGKQSEDLATTSTNGYLDSNGSWTYALNVQNITYPLYSGGAYQAYINEAGNEVTPSETRDVYYYKSGNKYFKAYKSGNKYYDATTNKRIYNSVTHIYEYKVNGIWRDCYYYDGWFSNYYADWETDNEISSSGVVNKQDGKVTGSWITIHYVELRYPDYYDDGTNTHTTPEELRAALISAAESASKQYLTYDGSNGSDVIFITYDLAYDSEDAYLLAEKGYYMAKTITCDSYVENFSSTGAQTALTFTNSMTLIKDGSITVTKTIDKTDEIGTKTFVFQLRNDSTESPAYGMVSYKTVNLKGNEVRGNVIFSGLPMGTYEITEVKNMDYSQIAPVGNCSISLVKTDYEKSVYIENAKGSTGGFSDTSVAVNNGTISEQTIYYRKEQ